MPLQAGQILNTRYRIVKLLGQGGFGAVYRAWDLNLNLPRAIKENLETSPEAAQQFALAMDNECGRGGTRAPSGKLRLHNHASADTVSKTTCSNNLLQSTSNN